MEKWQSLFVATVIAAGNISSANAEILILDCGEHMNNKKVVYSISDADVRLIGFENSNILNSSSRLDDSGRIISSMTVNIAQSPSFFITTISPLNEDRTDYQVQRVNSVDGQFEVFGCERDVDLETRIVSGISDLLLDLEDVQNPSEVLIEAISDKHNLNEDHGLVEDRQVVVRPLTGGEEDRLRQAVSQCWVVDQSADWGNVVVTVGFSLTQEGKVSGDVRLQNASAGSEDAVKQAFESARRAILRCQSSGYPLPLASYEYWKDVELTFDPITMRVR